MSVAVTDTHALIWHITGESRKLGPRARAFFERADRGAATVFVPALAIVELAEAAHRGVLGFDGGISRWVASFLQSGGFVAADLTLDVVVAAERLYMIPERGDRLVAATALHLDCPLITRDPAMSRIAGLDALW